MGVVVAGGSLVVHLWRCDFGLGVTHGVVVNEAAAVVDCRFKKCAIAMLVDTGAQLEVEDCDCEGDDHGIRAEPGAYAVTADGVRGAHRATAAPDAPGCVTVVGNTVSDATIGMQFQGRGNDACVLLCQVLECSCGVCVSAAAKAWMHQLRMSGGTDGVTIGCLGSVRSTAWDLCTQRL